MPKPKTSLLTYDDARMSRPPFSGGISPEVAAELADRLKLAKRELLEDWKRGRQGWLGCPDEKKLIARVEALAKKKKAFSTCLIIGIGGSDLGARAAYQALGQDAKGMCLEFLGANTDPDEIDRVLSRLDAKKTLVNIISKSGDTVEPMSTFFVVLEWLQKRVGKKSSQQIVATTDEERGSLRAFALEQGIDMLPVPKNIGGRFSILTPVGLFPLACAGIRIRDLLSGAAEIRAAFMKSSTGGDPANFAAHHVIGDMVLNRHIHILMPYSSRLEAFGKWFRQIWAESLGKAETREGKKRHQGPTPIAALGATDQHSQIQLYMEGPEDKLITFIEVEQFTSKLRVPALAKHISSMSFLAGRSFADIIHAEREATSQALAEAGRPNGTLYIKKVDAKSLGALFMFFEIATGVAGSLMNVNTYDQPGVEAGKVRMYAILGR